MNKRLGLAFLTVGVLFVSLSLIVDVIELGKKGIEAVQIAGIMAGFFLGLLGWGLRSLPENTKPLRQLFVEKVNALLNLPVIVWVLIGFLIVFLLYFVRPMFFDDSRK